MLNEGRSDLMIWALPTCAHCNGTGLDAGEVCMCINRAVCRMVLAKFRECAAGAHHLRPRSLEVISGPRGKAPNGSKFSEYLADVYLTAKRTLSAQDFDVFRFHHLLGNEWRVCCQRFGMTRGNAFHTFYKIEEQLGRVFRELKPYALYPHDEYFQRTTKTVDVRPFPVPQERFSNGVPLRAPLRAPLAPRAPQARPQPVLVVCKPEPVLVVAPFNLTDPAAIAGYIRDRWHARRGIDSIATELNRLGVPPANGTRWRSCDVKNVLLYAPRPQLRKAA